ncbi:MAG: hypothetical protein K1X86_00130 [Ignavibacteria bacterium]|nr:hypothetical protein [Ignavibacteria bacterium]
MDFKFGSNNNYEYLEFMLKLEYENDRLSLLKSYNSDGDLIKKFTFQYGANGRNNTLYIVDQNSDSIFKKITNIDSKGILTLPYLHFLRDIEDDVRIEINDKQQNSSMLTSESKLEDESYDQANQLFIYSAIFNLLSYKRYSRSEEETMYGFKKTEIVEQKFKLKYSDDTYDNPMEIILHGDMDEPDYEFTFEYF